MRTATRKQLWTEAEWRAYVVRLCRIRRILWTFVFEMPPSRGLRSIHHMKPFADAHGQIVQAMIRLENVVVDHLGGEGNVPGGAIAFCQGRSINMPNDPSDCIVGYVKGNAKPGEPPLAQERWIEWGAKGLEAHNLINAAIGAVYQARGKGAARHIGQLEKTQRSLVHGRGRLDTLVCQQYPTWQDAIRVFYGQNSAQPEQAT